jgi:hypothetical protein
MESNDATGSPSARAAELRASLGARREAEELLAEASATRRAAAADADAIVEEAQQLAGEVLAEARAAADRLIAEAGERAEAVLAEARAEADAAAREARAASDEVRARAEAEIEEHRRRVRSEVTAQVTRELQERNRADLARHQDRQEAVVGDLEASVRILGVSLDSAAAHVTEMLGALADLRTPPDEPSADQPVEASAGEQPRAGGADDLFRATTPRRRQGVPEVPIPPDPAGPAQPEGSDEPQGRPLTATEAFLRSAHLDHGDPPLPPMDDAEVGARYARDAMRTAARSRSRQDSETLGLDPGRAAPARRGADEREGRDRVSDERTDDGRTDDERSGEPAGKPLGWLFRSP